MPIIGIDLGTTYSLACVYRNGKAELIPNELGQVKTPSAVSVLEDGSVLVGAAAKERLITHPESTAASFKVWMGTERGMKLGDRVYKPEELSALVLRQLREDAQRYLGEPVEEAIISVPAYFNDDQRCATKLAAELAGLQVRRLINEPSAAALYHRYSAQGRDRDRGRDGDEDGNWGWDEDRRLMIIDFGGGTLDVSIVECYENIIEITAIAGDNHLGGDDVDRAIVSQFLQENGLEEEKLEPALRAGLYRQAETAKIALSRQHAAMITVQAGENGTYSLLLTRRGLRELCEPIFRKVRGVISQAMKNRERQDPIDDVVLVGGSAQLEVFADYLEDVFGGRRPAVAERPDEIVALGVGLCAGIKERAEDLQDIVMTDVCPFSLGVATYNNAGDRKPHMAFLIQRSTMLPASQQCVFCTLHENQQFLRFEIYQGEGYYAAENLKLGELTVQVPPGPAGQQYATVTFTYDIDGILHVSARSSGGDCRDRLILNPRIHLTEEQRQQALARMEEIRLAAQGSQREQLVLERAQGLFRQAIGWRREMLAQIICTMQSALESQNLIERKRLCETAEQELNQTEEEMKADPLADGIWSCSEDEESQEEEEEQT